MLIFTVIFIIILEHKTYAQLHSTALIKLLLPFHVSLGSTLPPITVPHADIKCLFLQLMSPGDFEADRTPIKTKDQLMVSCATLIYIHLL